MRKSPSLADIITWQQSSDNSNKKTASKINRHFNKEIFDLGTEWSLSGKTFEEARPEMQNDRSFADGFKRGERLKKIAELDSAPKTR